MILVDANVFVLDLRYARDRLYQSNRAFLDALAASGNGAVTLYTLLEVAGILSFNLNPRQLRELVVHFPRRYGVAVLPPADLSMDLPMAGVGAILARMEKRCSMGDALAMEAAERVAGPGAVYVTWDADHFTGRTTLHVQTPAEWLEEQTDGPHSP